jgi:hypothetical protein
MKRLRHPVRAIREPFGTAGLVVACVALILALTGAAFAAAGLTGKQKKEVEKIAKKFAGKPGAPGASGPAGPQGPTGAKGDAGVAGANGTNGSNGESVKVSSYEGPECSSEEGAEVKNGSGTVYVCSGEPGLDGAPGAKGDPGAQGPQGEPWTAGGTLPPGATETGTWMVTGTEDDTSGVFAAMSFPIPMPFALRAQHTHFVTQEEAGCLEQFPGEEHEQEYAQCIEEVEARCGSSFAVLNPTAAPGELCVYEDNERANADFVTIRRPIGPPTFPAEGASRTGAVLQFEPTGGTVYGMGSFAVTSCTKEVGEPFECPPGS